MLNNFIVADNALVFNEALLKGEILDEAIVFIKQSKQIWTHGTFYDGNKVDLSNIEASIPAVNHGTSNTTFELTPNIYYKWDTVTNLTLTLADAPEDTYNEYMFLFTSGDTATTLSVPSTILWAIQPNILSNRTYQCSIVNNIGILVSV